MKRTAKKLKSLTKELYTTKSKLMKLLGSKIQFDFDLKIEEKVWVVTTKQDAAPLDECINVISYSGVLTRLDFNDLKY